MDATGLKTIDGLGFKWRVKALSALGEAIKIP